MESGRDRAKLGQLQPRAGVAACESLTSARAVHDNDATAGSSKRRGAGAPSTRYHEPRGARVDMNEDDGGLEAIRKLLASEDHQTFDQTSLKQTHTGSPLLAKHQSFSNDALATPARARPQPQRDLTHLTDRSKTPTMTSSPRTLFPESPTTPRTPLSTPGLDPDRAALRRPSMVSSSDGSLPTTPDLGTSSVAAFPNLNMPTAIGRGEGSGRPTRLGSPFLYDDKGEHASLQHSAPTHRQSILPKHSPSALPQQNFDRPKWSVYETSSQAMHSFRKMSAPALAFHSPDNAHLLAEPRVPRLPRTSSHGALRMLSEPMTMQQQQLKDLPAAHPSSRRSSIFAGFNALKSLKRRDSAASVSTATSTQTWTSTSSYRTNTSSHGRGGGTTLKEVDEAGFEEDEAESVKSKGSNGSQIRSSKAMALLGLEPADVGIIVKSRHKLVRAGEKGGEASGGMRLCDLTPFELASDTVFTYSLPSNSSRSLIKSSKRRWHLSFISLAQQPDGTITLHQFKSPTSSSDVELERLQLSTETKIFVPEEDGLLTSEVGHALRIMIPETRDRSTMTWTLGMETSEQMSKWLKILKEAVLRLKQGDGGNEIRNSRQMQVRRLPSAASVQLSPISPRQVRLSFATKSEDAFDQASELPYVRRTPSPDQVSRTEVHVQDICDTRREEESQDESPKFRHPFAALAGDVDDSSQQDLFDFGGSDTTSADGLLSPTQVALGTYYATWHGGAMLESTSRANKRLSTMSRQSIPERLPPPAHDLPLPLLPTNADSAITETGSNQDDTFDLISPLPPSLKRLSINTATTTTSASSCTSSLRSRLSNAPLPPLKLPPPSSALPPIPSSSHSIA
ncbi:hypothetical protein ACM66B_006762 [Microbotryomycetes sp. NB124-2]